MSLDNFVAKFPPGLVAFVVITLGILVIVLNDPPQTVCDAAEEVFKNEHRDFLAPNPKSTKGLSVFDEQKELCKHANGPGGCYVFFSQVRDLIASVEGTSKECRPQIGEIPLVKKAFFQTVNLFAHLAWGGKPPNSTYEKVGWFDYADINVFCRLKDKFNEIYGVRAWQELQEGLFTSLPGVKTVPRDRAWKLMLLSTNCNQYQ